MEAAWGIPVSMARHPLQRQRPPRAQIQALRAAGGAGRWRVQACPPPRRSRHRHPTGVQFGALACRQVAVATDAGAEELPCPADMAANVADFLSGPLAKAPDLWRTYPLYIAPFPTSAAAAFLQSPSPPS